MLQIAFLNTALGYCGSLMVGPILTFIDSDLFSERNRMARIVKNIAYVISHSHLQAW